MKRSVLVTGFEPFGDFVENPSARIAESLHGRRIRARKVESVVLPVEFGRSRRILTKELRRVEPELVVCLGLAGNRSAFSLERVAINVDDARIPDNAGRQPVDTPIVASGPAAYWSTLPIKAVAAVLRDGGYPVEISQSAGTYVCNHVFYGLMRWLRYRGEGRGGFIHLPPATKTFGIDRMVDATELAIETALRTRTDRREAGGAVS